MSTKTTLIIFAVVFALALLLIVILPFFITRGPQAPSPAPAGGNAQDSKTVTDQGVFRSDDGGVTWKQKAFIEGESGSIAALQINALVADPVDVNTLYLATAANGLWVSHSRGDLWAKVSDITGVLDPLASVFNIAVNPANTNEWYLAVFQKNRGRVLRTADGGKSFREIYFTPLERYGVFDVYYDRGRSAVDIVTGQGGLLETKDGGRTWRVVRWFADGLIKLIVNPANPSVRFVVTPHGSIFRTQDGGESWDDATPGLNAFSAADQNQNWFVDPSGGLYLGSSYGLLRSRDNASTFTALPLIIPPDALPIRAVAVAPSNTSRIMLSVNGEMFGSRDDGATWSIIMPPSAKHVTTLLFDRTDEKIIYAVVNQ